MCEPTTICMQMHKEHKHIYIYIYIYAAVTLLKLTSLPE